MKLDSVAMARRIAEQVAAVGGRTYYVGGYVRDCLMGRESKDVDIEVHGIEPCALTEILGGLGEVTTMGASFGIFGLKHYDLDIAMPRAAGCTDVSDPFVGEQAAARRRDLTINALMQDVLTGAVLDFFGGAADLERGVLRHVDAATFAEDPLRVLRVAQFAARFGFSVAEETADLCSRLDLQLLPRERVFAELQKAMLKAEKPSVFFETLRAMGQLTPWFAEVEALIGVPQDPRHHPEGDVWNHTMLVLDRAAELLPQAEHPEAMMLAALCHDFGKPLATQIEADRIRALGHEEQGMPLAKTFLQRLTGEVGLFRYVCNMVELHMRPNLLAAQNSKPKAVCSLLDRSVCPHDLLLLAKADHFGKIGAEPYEPTEQYLQHGLALYRQRMAVPHVTGADLVAAGFVPGEEFGRALAHARALQLAGVDRTGTLKQTIAWLRTAESRQN